MVKFSLSAVEHVVKAKRNRKILQDYLLQSVENCPEWVSVVAFYSALHYVDAYFSKCGQNFQRHDERNREIELSLPEIFTSYYRLYDISVNSRYGCMDDNPTVDEAKDLVETDLPKVSAFMEGLIR